MTKTLFTIKEGEMSGKIISSIMILGLVGSIFAFAQDAKSIEYKYPSNNKVLVYSPSYTDGDLDYVADKSGELFNQASFVGSAQPDPQS